MSVDPITERARIVVRASRPHGSLFDAVSLKRGRDARATIHRRRYKRVAAIAELELGATNASFRLEMTAMDVMDVTTAMHS